MNYIPHWPNPWSDVVYVPIEELVEVAQGIGEFWGDASGGRFIMTREMMLEHWGYGKSDLDAYILPQPSGWHDIGIRYGSLPNEYLSPGCDKARTEALLRKYR